jgi:hypothetical protein
MFFLFRLDTTLSCGWRKDRLHVFVDESGDLGFKEKATKFFVVAYLECDSSQRIRIEMRRVLKHLHQKGQYSLARNELKFARMDAYCRKYVLDKIVLCDVSLGVVILEKARVSLKLRQDPRVLFNWCVVHNIMLSLLPNIVAGSKVNMVFDRSLPSWRINEFNAYVENKASYLLSERKTKFSKEGLSSEHVSSELEPCLQAADAVAGAYFQKYEHQNDEYVKIIENKVGGFKYLWRK